MYKSSCDLFRVHRNCGLETFRWNDSTWFSLWSPENQEKVQWSGGVCCIQCQPLAVTWGRWHLESTILKHHRIKMESHLSSRDEFSVLPLLLNTWDSFWPWSSKVAHLLEGPYQRMGRSAGGRGSLTSQLEKGTCDVVAGTPMLTHWRKALVGWCGPMPA